jgi:signal transduction histidine kinase
LHSGSIVEARTPLQLGQLIVIPFATVGVLAAVLMWEIEHVGSAMLAVTIAAGGIIVGIAAAVRLRRDFRSVTRHYQQLLRMSTDQAREAEVANRLKDEFLGTLSHELRTPLNTMLGWARLLRSAKPDQEHIMHAVTAIERAGWTQSHLIDDLLDMSRIVAGTFRIAPRDTCVQPLVEEAVDSLRQAAEAKHIALDVELDATTGPVVADPNRLRQAVWNLISNAIKFTPAGGQVTVRLVKGEEDLRLSVQDTGVGFTPDVAAHLFQRFRQGDGSSTRAQGGLGLGLAIVRHVVELHGGTVRAHSPGVNRGSVFEVCLPRAISHALAE